jgi:hypothetical protein
LEIIFSCDRENNEEDTNSQGSTNLTLINALTDTRKARNLQ